MVSIRRLPSSGNPCDPGRDSNHSSPQCAFPLADRWSPYEIALFESGICLTGKLFPQLAKIVGSKSCKEVIEFYYLWKKSKNYQQWKVSYKATAGDADN